MRLFCGIVAACCLHSVASLAVAQSDMPLGEALSSQDAWACSILMGTPPNGAWERLPVPSGTDTVVISFAPDGTVAIYFASILGDLIFGPVDGTYAEVSFDGRDGEIELALDDYAAIEPVQFEVVVVATQEPQTPNMILLSQLPCVEPQLQFPAEVDWLPLRTSTPQ